MSRWLVLVALAGCGGRAHVRHEGEGHIESIRVEGNHAIASGALIDGLALSRRHEVDDYQLSLDTTRIAGAYQRLGYLSVDVRSRLDKHPDGGADVVFTVIEGKRATTRVEIEGLPDDVRFDEARARIKLDDGAPFSYQAYDDAKTSIQQLLEDAGYARVHLDAGVIADRAHNEATAKYVIAPGPRCTFGEISIRGTDGALAEAALTHLAFHSGERYSRASVAASQNALLGLGRFSTARIEPDRTGDATAIQVNVSVAEAKRNEGSLGLAFGLDPLNYALQAHAKYTRSGVISPLSTFSADFKPGFTALRATCRPYFLDFGCQYEPRIRLLGNLAQPDLLLPDIKGEVEGGLDYLTIEAYTSAGARLRPGLSWAPRSAPWLQLRVGWQLAAYEFPRSSINAAIDDSTRHRLGLDQTEVLGAYTQALIIDLRDHPIEPTIGGYFELRLAEGTRYAGGAFDYLQLTPEARGYLPIGPLQLAARLRVGVITGDVPVTERYYGGGASSHRGFSERRLSPTASNVVDGVTNTVVIGGAGLIETGAELRAPLGKPFGLDLSGALFLDAGDVTASPAQLDPSSLHWAMGTGVRWFVLPVLAVRIDVAYRLNRYGVGEPDPGQRFNYFLSVGEAY